MAQHGVLGLVGAGVLPRVGKRHTGLHTGSGGVWGGEAGVPSEPHAAVLIYTFPPSLGKLPFAAVQQVVAVAGLAVVSVLQHLHIALDVDESFGLQLM